LIYLFIYFIIFFSNHVTLICHEFSLNTGGEEANQGAGSLDPQALANNAAVQSQLAGVTPPADAIDKSARYFRPN
jgi:hypothetical protein